MKTLKKIILFSIFTMSMGTVTSCKDKDKEVDEIEITDDTITTKEELSTSATDTVVRQ